MNNLKLAVAQMNSTDQIALNLKQVSELYTLSAGADLIVYPENSMFFRIESGSKVTGLDLSGDELLVLQRLVDGQGTALMLTTPINIGGDKLANGTVLLRPGSEPQLVYKKIHLFDVDVEGAPPVRESDHFVSGSGPELVQINGWNVGLSVCYDLRFPELYLHYAQKADLILVPSAFLVPTGEAHWHTLLRARAIESQSFLAAPAQAGAHKSASGQVRHTYGHSLIVDPWGRISKELHSAPEVGIVELKREAIAKVRQQIPMASHRRL